MHAAVTFTLQNSTQDEVCKVVQFLADKGAPLDDQEAMAVLNTLIKQRKDSIEQFTKGGRQELADKEAAEIVMIEAYLPKAAGQEEVEATVRAAISEMGSPTMKEMGAVMKNAMAKFAASGTRVDGKIVSETVKKLLSSTQLKSLSS